MTDKVQPKINGPELAANIQAMILKKVEEGKAGNVNQGGDANQAAIAGGIGACCAVCCCAPIMIALFIIGPLLCIGMVVVGFIFKEDCAIEPMIPIWLIVSGFFGIFNTCSGGGHRKTGEHEESTLTKVIKVLNVFISLFVFAWFIAGNVWVFRTWNMEPEESECNPHLLRVALAGVIIPYCLIPLFCCLGCLGCCAFAKIAKNVNVENMQPGQPQGNQ